MAVDEALDGVTGAWHDTLPPGKHQLAVHLPSAEGRDVDKQVQLLRPRRPPFPHAAQLAPPNLAAFASRVTKKNSHAQCVRFPPNSDVTDAYFSRQF